MDDLPPWKGLLAIVLTGGLIVGLCFALLLPSAVILVSSQEYKPNVGLLRQLAQRSTIYDNAGNVLAVLGTENREDVTLEEVPKILRKAVIAVEDKTFWSNSGIDPHGVFRAFVKNVTSGQIEQGGSTITQQLVKTRILTPKRSLRRKIREVILALRITKRLGKHRILQEYLNTVYFGQGSYGVKAAVERFFLTPGAFSPAVEDLKDVTIGQAALLAGLISNPEGDNPFVHPDRALARRTFALQRMVDAHVITRAQAEAANKEPMPSIKPEAELRPHNSWAEEVQDRLIHDQQYKVLGATADVRRTRILTGGLKITATLDPGIQRAAQNAMNDILPEKPGFTGALVAIDPASGFVKAMVAGPGFEQSQYNIATTYPGRQAGSTWKVITLATALENGFSPKDTVSGASPCSFGVWGRTRNAEGGGGRMTIRSATAQSVNCAFARIELAVGLDKVIATAHKMGIQQQTLKPILTLTLGTIESTPLEMATVAATIADGGIHHNPQFVTKIVAPDKSVVFDATKNVQGDRAISADTAACETDLLRGVISGGTGTAARLRDNRPVAGKTGTTDSKADANFLGFTPQLAAFVWHGNINAQIPGAGFGGQVPARIFKEFMDSALVFQQARDFPEPGPTCDRQGAYVSEKGRGLPVKDTVPVNRGPVVTAPPVTAPPVTSPPATSPPPPPT